MTTPHGLKTLIALVLLLITVPVCMYVPAQEPREDRPVGTDEPDPPAVPQATTVPQFKTIFDYRQELDLSSEQEREIRQLLQGLARTLRVANAKLIVINAEIEDMIDAEADLEKIHAKLREEADVRVHIRYEDIKVSRRISNVLNPEQKAKWKQIQEQSRQQEEEEAERRRRAEEKKRDDEGKEKGQE